MTSSRRSVGDYPYFIPDKFGDRIIVSLYLGLNFVNSHLEWIGFLHLGLEVVTFRLSRLLHLTLIFVTFLNGGCYI